MKWFWEKVFEELQDKDFLVMIIVFILFLLILFDKLSENNDKEERSVCGAVCFFLRVCVLRT